MNISYVFIATITFFLTTTRYIINICLWDNISFGQPRTKVLAMIKG
jgi:hypothetical protein